MISNSNMICSDSDTESCLILSKDNLVMWDFYRIREKAIGFNGSPYCLGQDNGGQTKCKVPEHDKAGKIDFELDTRLLPELSEKLRNDSEYFLTVTATGDNDTGDCSHTELSLSVSLEYTVER